MTSITVAEVVTRGFMMALFYDHVQNKMIEVYELNDKFYAIDQAEVKIFYNLDKANEYAEKLAGPDSKMV